MAQNNTFAEYVVHDLLGHIDGVTARAMFGGHGIYKDGVIFAIIADDELYFKVDESNRAQYEARGSHPFVYAKGGHKSTTMSYWLVPQDILEDKDRLREWVEQSVAISAAKKPKGAN